MQNTEIVSSVKQWYMLS